MSEGKKIELMMVRGVLTVALFATFALIVQAETEDVPTADTTTQLADTTSVEVLTTTTQLAEIATSEEVLTLAATDSPVIFGGAGVTSRSDYPWVARIGCYNQDKYATDSGNCAGSLISTTHVLTAAHCLYVPTDFVAASRGLRRGRGFTLTKSRSKATNCRVTLGDLAPSTTEGTEVERIVRGNNIYPHESFDPSKSAQVRSNDIGMLKIDAVTLGANVNVIALAATSPPSGANLKILGWGLKTDGSLSSSLQVADAEIRSSDYCAASWNCASRTRFNSSQQVCYGGDGSVVVCKGDGGGPAVLTAAGVSTLVAVHSFSRLSSSSWQLSAFGACNKLKPFSLWYRVLGSVLPGTAGSFRVGRHEPTSVQGGPWARGRHRQSRREDSGEVGRFSDTDVVPEARGNLGSYVCDAGVPSVGTYVAAFSTWITQTQLKLA